jgi:hypothetical protein
MTEYDPNNPDDPLRHRYLDRAKRSSYAMPIEVKIANGLGVPPPTPVQRVAARARNRLGLS